MKKGIRNLQNRLDNDYYKTVAELEADGLVFTDCHHFNFSSYVDEESGRCITPYKERSTDFSAYDDEFEAYGYKFSLRLYELFDFWKPECKVDFSSIECWDFQKFADELNDLLESEGVIMRTWKYKASALLPAPVCVWDGWSDRWNLSVYGRVYKLPKINYKKLEKVAAKIKKLALSHLVWDEVDDEQEAI